jgi:SAM-dependent methyltransferase
MDPKRFYDDRWRDDPQRPVQRDWLHRLVLDRIFDPTANPRPEVALSLLQGGGRLLDIGCWNGGFLARVERAGLYEELHGVDLVAEGVELARERGFQAQVADLNHDPLPFPDRHFDGVAILAVLEHLFDPNVASLTNRARILLGRLPVTSADAGWDGGHLHYFTKHALDRFLQVEGFDVLARKTTGGRSRLRERWISLLGGEFIYRCRRR